jgi:hypothetical protein
MANLFKEAKRGKHRPRVLNGSLSTGQTVEWMPPDDSGMCTARQLLHTLDVWSGSGEGRVEYQVQLTDDEMIRVTSEWLVNFHHQQQQRTRDAQRKPKP